MLPPTLVPEPGRNACQRRGFYPCADVLDPAIATGVEVAAGPSSAPAPAAARPSGMHAAGEPGAVTAAPAAVTAILASVGADR